VIDNTGNVLQYTIIHFFSSYRLIQEIFLGIKRPVLEADHSSPSSADVRNAWRIGFGWLRIGSSGELL
jgi:hypothetical protein